MPDAPTDVKKPLPTDNVLTEEPLKVPHSSDIGIPDIVHSTCMYVLVPPSFPPTLSSFLSSPSFPPFFPSLSFQAAGKYRQQGRNYIVEDGDIVFFKFNAGAGLTSAKKK